MKSTIVVAGLLLIAITVINAYPRRRPVYDVTGQDRTPYNKYGGHVDNQQEEEEEQVALALVARKECAARDRDFCKSVCGRLKMECNLQTCECAERMNDKGPKKGKRREKQGGGNIQQQAKEKKGQKKGRGNRGKVEKVNGLFFYY